MSFKVYFQRAYNVLESKRSLKKNTYVSCPAEEVNLNDPQLAEDKTMRAGAADSNFVADFRALTQAIRFEERKNDSYVN